MFIGALLTLKKWPNEAANSNKDSEDEEVAH
jgi:hypothetical protein